MRLNCILIFALVYLTTAAGPGRGDGKDEPKQNPPPAFMRLLQGSADDFIRRFDRNKDGYLTRDELPPRLAGMFDKLDRNGDGKLDRDEVDKMLQMLRQRPASGTGQPGGAKPADVQKRVAAILEKLDTNKDGKISRAEARVPFAKNFDAIDTNKDGYLDREELTRAVRRLLSNPNAKPAAGKGAAKPQPPNKPGPTVDFDALDLNADGRLTRAELKGTPYEKDFDSIDTNKDGKIDRKEFAAYLKKQAEKKEKSGNMP
jgi:Ca2+-binding EF-hand superfamily protein